MPTIDDTFFVYNNFNNESDSANGKRLSNNFEFTPGFRAGLEYAMKNNHTSVQAFYSQVISSQKRTVNGDYLTAIMGNPDTVQNFYNYTGSASSNLDLFYQRVDLNFNQLILNTSVFKMSIQPGFEYARLNLSEHYKYVDTVGEEGTTTTRLKSHTWGVGPQIGLGLDYNFFQRTCGENRTHVLSFTSLFSGSLLASKFKNSYYSYNSYYENEYLNDVTEKMTWRVIPALHARMGLNYLIRGENVGFNIGAGYEFNSYIRGSSRVLFYDDGPFGNSSTQFNNFDIQGLYILGSISF